MININEEVRDFADKIEQDLYNAFDEVIETITTQINEENFCTIDDLKTDLYIVEEKLEDLEDKELVQENNNYCDKLENFFYKNIELYY